jgi:hypothetical protein
LNALYNKLSYILLTRQSILATHNKGVNLSGISKIIKSIDPDEDEIAIPNPKQQSKLGLQPLVDEALPNPSPKRLETRALDNYSNIGVENPRWILTVTLTATLIWLISAVIITVSSLRIIDNWQSFTPMQWAGFVTMILGPLIMIGIAAYAMRQLARISAQATQLQIMADRLSQPDQLILERSETMSSAIAQHVDLINTKLNEGVGRISALEDILKNQTAYIEKANKDAEASAQSMDQHLQAQKTAFETIAATYDERMGGLSEMMDTHAQNLTIATRLAEQKIKEARISVEGATAKINSASDIVRANTVQAASTLSGSHDEIKSLGDIIKQRSDELDEVYKKHANDLTTMIEHLRDEQQNLGANMEDTFVKMRDLSLSAQASAESLSDASSAGKETIQSLAQSASLADDAVKTRFAEMEQMVRYSTEHAQNINSVASQRVQDSLEQTRTEIARIERDMAGLQDKLQRSALPSARPKELESPGARPSTRERKARVHLKPIQFSEQEQDEEEIEIPETGEDNGDKNLSDRIGTITDEEKALDLHIETPDIREIKQGLVSSDPILAAIRPVAEYESNKKSKSGFSLRDLFGGRSDENDDASMSIAGSGSNLAERKRAEDNADRNFVRALTEMGLSPNVIVDDGCVIEAANNRASQGHEAMSRSVIARLNVPVKHFAATLSSDPELSKRTIGFATDFDQKVEKLAGDREAIRTRLESEGGRAYLICDAALNYGRV